MNTHGNCRINEDIQHALRSKNKVHLSEAVILEEDCFPKTRPPVRTVKNTVQIKNGNQTNVRPLIPSVNETVPIDSQCNQLLYKNKLNVSPINDAKVSETRLFMEKQKKERLEKKKLDLLEKKRIDEERKKRLNELHKTTRELAKSSTKHKIQNSTITSPKHSEYVSPVSKATTENKTPHIHKVANLENIHTEFKFGNEYLLTDSHNCDISIQKLDNTDSILEKKDYINVKQMKDNCHDIENLVESSFSLKKNMTEDKLNLNSINTETETDLELSRNKIFSCIETTKKSLAKEMLTVKNCSESTQTDIHNTSPLFFSKECSQSSNYLSTLKCKNNLQITENNNLKLVEPDGKLSVSEFLMSNNLPLYKNNNESIGLSIPHRVDSDNIVNAPSINLCEEENCLNTLKSSKNDETMNSVLNNTNNVCKENTSLVINDDLNTNLNIIINEDIKQVVNKLNCKFDQLINNSCCNTNNLHNKSGHLELCENDSVKSLICFPEIHYEFQAELELLDELNNSLNDIEKMDCDVSIKADKQCVYGAQNDLRACNNSNIKTTSNLSCKPSCSKQNSLSLSLSVDKAITDFSIQMFEQLIKDEEFRVKEHLTINNLKEKSLVNRLKWEVTMCDIQLTNSKFRPVHEKEFQLFKQQHRGRIKKLEHSLSQVKRLGRVIDMVYKQRIIMLKEHLQNLRMQSSSKKVIRKLKSLNQIPRKEENTHRSRNSQFFDQHDKNKLVESEQFHTNVSGANVSFENDLSMVQSEKITNVILRDQATSPIHFELKRSKDVNDVDVQTDFEHPTNNTSLPTTKALFTNNDNCSTKLNVPVVLSYKNELPDDNIINNKLPLSLTLLANHVKVMKPSSDSSISTNSDQGDIMVERISILQEQLEARKLESSKLRKKQKRFQLENLKAKEQGLLKQIEFYDKQIEESKKCLMTDVEKKSSRTSKCSTNQMFPSTQTANSNFQNTINTESHCLSVDCSSKSHAVDKMRLIKNDDKSFSPITTINLNNHNISSQDEIVRKLKQKVVDELKENLIINFTNHSITENNYDGEIIPLHEESIVIEIDNLKKSQEKSSIPQFVSQKSQLTERLAPSLLNHEDISKQDYPTKINKVVDLDSELSSHKRANHNPFILDISDNQTVNHCVENSTTCYENLKDNHPKTSMPDHSNSQRKCFVKINDNVCSKTMNNVNQLEILNNEIKTDSIDGYSPDFTSDENTSEFQEPHKCLKNDKAIGLHYDDQSNESSYEEDRSEGEVVFEEKTFIERYSDDNDLIQDTNVSDDKVDIITSNIFNCLLEDTKKTLKINTIKPLCFLKSSELNNLTEETPLLMILKREEEHQNMIFISKQATAISDIIFKRHLQPLLFESLQIYKPLVNNIEIDKLKLYLYWSSNKKKLKSSEHLKFQNKTLSDINCDKPFEIFYQEYQEQKICATIHDESSEIMLSQTQQEAKKLKLEELRIEEEIERLRISEEESQMYVREIPNKPPPPYKSPTKKKVIVHMPYTSVEVRSIVLAASAKLFNDLQSSMPSKDNIDSDLHTGYKTLMFDYCKEIALDMFTDEENVPIWKKPMKKLRNFRARPKNPEDLTDIVIKKLNKILDIDDCEEKVDKFIVKQMYEEDSKWTDFQMDELNIQNDIVQSLMKKLISDTATNMENNFCMKFM